MTIVVIDFRPARRTGVARLSDANPADVFETCPDGIGGVVRPRLALWHVGYDQNTEEGGGLRDQLDEFLTQDRSWVAAYTGGQLPRALVPTESDHFVVRAGAGPDAAPNGAFRTAIENTVALWKGAGGVFAPGQLQKVWAGRDVVESTARSVLADLWAQRNPSPEAIQLLHRTGAYPSLSSEIEAYLSGDPGALSRLRKLLFP